MLGFNSSSVTVAPITVNNYGCSNVIAAFLHIYISYSNYTYYWNKKYSSMNDFYI